MSARVAAAEISHETNVFSSTPTDLEAFHASGLVEGQAIVARARGTNSSFGGFIDGAEAQGFDLLPLIAVWATPSGIVSGSALKTLDSRLCAALQNSQPLHGVLLALHGAMVSEIDHDGDAHILESVRATIGKSVPLVATLDLHANISPRMIAAADLLIGYDTYPHVDMAERAREAAALLARLIRGEISPVTALVKPPMLPTSQRMTTDREPMDGLMRYAQAVEATPGVLNVTIAGGFPPADVPEAGASILVATDDDSESAVSLAGELATELWNRRADFLGGVTSFEDAAAAIQARSQDNKPLVVVDIGDNPWTGGPGDSAVLLDFFLREQVSNGALALVKDPESVMRCIQGGVGSAVELALGGMTDSLHGPPLQVHGRVRMLSDGRYVNKGPMMAGVQVDLGATAVVQIDGVTVLVTSRAETPIDLNVFRAHGIEPAKLSVIGLKGKGHFRAAFEPIASEVILVEGPGITGADLSRLPFANIRRPIWPLDPGLDWVFRPEQAFVVRPERDEDFG